MKKPLILAFFLALSAIAPAFAATNAATASVTDITFMGGLWQNNNRGGFYFHTTAMPAGISYFIVRGTDTDVKALTSVILAAKASGVKIMVSYNVTGSEGDVVSITMM